MSNLITVDAARMIDGFKEELEPLVSDTGKSFDRLKSVFLIAVQQNPDILKCSPDSIRREIGKCAADGLVPDNKEAAMIPYKGILQYQPMVHGIVKRLRELGDVFSITCRLVYAEDQFVLNEADPDSLVHTSDPFSTTRGDIVGGYAIFRDDQKRLMHLETMSMEDFQNVRNASKAPGSPAWTKWASEMYRKAVLRRGAKYISTNNDKIRALLERQDDMFESFNQQRQTERVDPFTGQVLDGEVVKPAEQVTHQREERREESRQQQRESTRTQTTQTGNDRTAASKSEETKPATTKPATPPAVPDVSVNPDDHEKTVECVEKLLAIALDTTITGVERRGVLKSSAESWKSLMPEYLVPLVKACIDMSDWAIKKDIEGLPWAADHAMFVHKVKSLLEVDKLNVGKYP